MIKKAIITGSTGGLGQALVRKLLTEDVELILLIRKGSGRAKYLPIDNRIRIVNCPLNRIQDLQMTDKNVDAFFHLGWNDTSPEGRLDVRTQMKNVEFTLDAVDLAYRCGCKAFVGCGSQAEYGNKDEPLQASLVCSPEIAYGAAKLSASHMARIQCQKYGMRFNWVRVLSAYGPVDNPYSVVSQVIINSLFHRTTELTKGEQIWDLLYTSDIAEAFWLATINGINGKTYTIGCDQELSLRQELEIFAKLAGGENLVRFGARDYSVEQNMYLKADSSEIKTDTGWKQKVGIEEGAKRTVKFWGKMVERYDNGLYEEYFKAGKKVKWERSNSI